MYYNENILPDTLVVSKERSIFEFTLLREIISLQKPVLGICYGMQLLNVFLGGTLYQDIDSQIQLAIDHKKGYHTVVITENKFLNKGTFSVNSSHHQAIKELGYGLTTCAYSADNIIEAFYMDDYPYLLGVQWHPERMAESELSSELFMSFIKASNDSK